MLIIIKESLWKQFGASIDMLRNAILLFPGERWDAGNKLFYNAYHCLVFLDYYLTVPAPTNFSAPLPFTLSDNIPAHCIDDLVPDRIYSKQELLDYLQSSREKCHRLIAGLTEENINDRWIEQEENGRNYAVLELLLYNMRHVQHHAAQLNMLLRQQINNAPDWVSRASEDL